MLKLGDKTINKLYLGDKAISKAYLGDKLVFQSKKPTFLDYIESDGGQLIDSGIECTYDLKVKFKGSCSTDANKACFGGINLENRPVFFRYHWSPFTNHINLWCQNNDSNTANIDGAFTIGEILEATIDAPNGTAIINGVTRTFTPLEQGLTTGKSFSIFGRISNNGDVQQRPSRFYYFKIYKNDILVRDLRPCLDPSGVACMYDMVSKKYFYNQGTGTFTAGNTLN